MTRNREIRKVVEAKFFGNRVHQGKHDTSCEVVVNTARAVRDVNVINIPSTGRTVRMVGKGKKRVRRITF